jgi:2-C-methyl-D-erythritol 2,4-cyclodiphosphate synthase
MNIKIGIGEDSHQFSNQKKGLILGGFKLKNQLGLKANSDGDVILHSICNSFDIVINQGSLSNYADKLKEEGIVDSSVYLSYVMKEAQKKLWYPKSVSISLEAREPKLESYLKEIKESLSKLLKINKKNIGLTVTSGEDLSDFGRGKGIKAICVVVFKKGL